MGLVSSDTGNVSTRCVKLGNNFNWCETHMKGKDPMKTKTTIGKLFLVFCCISIVLGFALVGNAAADDENGRIEGRAEINCGHNDVNTVEIDLEGEWYEIYGLAECSAVENKNMVKVMCKGQGLPLFLIFPLEADNAIPVELTRCKLKRCDYIDGHCDVVYGHGQATLAANYKEIFEISLGRFHYEIDSANLSLACFFNKGDED